MDEGLTTCKLFCQYTFKYQVTHSVGSLLSKVANNPRTVHLDSNLVSHGNLATALSNGKTALVGLERNLILGEYKFYLQ